MTLLPFLLSLFLYFSRYLLSILIYYFVTCVSGISQSVNRHWRSAAYINWFSSVKLRFVALHISRKVKKKKKKSNLNHLFNLMLFSDFQKRISCRHCQHQILSLLLSLSLFVFNYFSFRDSNTICIFLKSACLTIPFNYIFYLPHSKRHSICQYLPCTCGLHQTKWRLTSPSVSWVLLCSLFCFILHSTLDLMSVHSAYVRYVSFRICGPAFANI